MVMLTNLIHLSYPDDAYGSMVSTNLKGSVFWMAPEVVHSVKGQGYSAKVDIWSLGCCVLEMWAGRRPWGDMEALAAMFQVRFLEEQEFSARTLF